MNEQNGPTTSERLSLHKVDCRAAGGSLTIPCDKGSLVISGPFPAWSFTLDGNPIEEPEVLELNQTDYSY